MKRFVWIVTLCAVIGLLHACGDLIEGSGNGKLDGNWHLTAVDTLATGGRTVMSADRKFLAVQGRLLVMSDGDETTQLMFRFSYADGRLSISDARLNDRELGDPAVTDVSLLQPYGISSLTETFDVDFPRSGRMTLTGPLLRLTFERF